MLVILRNAAENSLPPRSLETNKMLEPFLSFFHGEYNMECHLVQPDDIPQPYKNLLVHQNHMTSTLENFYGQKLQVKVDKHNVVDGEYKRSSQLWLPKIGVVELGIVFMDIAAFTNNVRSEILQGNKPLGKILMDHKEPRTIQVNTFFKIENNPILEQIFATSSIYLYGRITTIMCNVPIFVMEIIRP